MKFKDISKLVTNGNRKKNNVKTAQQIAVGVGVATLAAAAGVATGILIAPKSGRETWEDLKKNSKNGGSRQASSTCEGASCEKKGD